MEKIHVTVIAVIIILFAVFVISDEMFTPADDTKNEGRRITVESDDLYMMAKLTITEYKDKESVDKSQGVETEIQVVNGFGEYKLKNDTKYFKVGHSLIIDFENPAEQKSWTVSYWIDDDLILISSSSDLDGVVISFGEQVYSVDGELVDD